LIDANAIKEMTSVHRLTRLYDAPDDRQCRPVGSLRTVSGDGK
jgi:hypothetical protein